MRLTVKSTERLKLPAGKADHIEFDDDITGFGLRLREGGSRTWVYQYRIGSKQRRMVLGSAKSVPLGLARETAGELRSLITRPPLQASRPARACECPLPAGTAVTQRNVASLLSDIAKESGNVTSNRLRTTLYAFFGCRKHQGPSPWIWCPPRRALCRHSQRTRGRLLRRHSPAARLPPP
jgi:Arm DNA-binding domain